MGLVDSHCHLNFDPMSDDLPGVLQRAKDNGIDHLLCISVNIEDFPAVLKIAEDYPHIFASVGVHPNYQEVIEPCVEQLIELAKHDKVVAIGETGLDYFRCEGAGTGDLDWQHQRFIRHIEAGRATNKPLIIHTRQASDDTIRLLTEHQARDCGAVMHCFAEDWSVAKQALDLGFYISFSGIVTFKTAENLREVARKTPLDRVLVETDAPYLAPVPMRGKPNQPAFVKHTAEFVAELRGISLEELTTSTTDNFFHLFTHANRTL